MTAILNVVRKSNVVARMSPWNDRIYINLKGAASNCAGDRNLKIWIKGNTLTIEGGKGTRSDALLESYYQLRTELEAAGAVRNGYSDSIAATFTLDAPSRPTIEDIKGGAFDPHADGCE